MTWMTDDSDRRAIAWWLLTCCLLVFGMVVLGGVTRLTGSGLSMVDWRPVVGWLPPMSDAEWQASFALYQQSPEYQQVNAHMGVDDYKNIFWLEYLHRLLGRLIGLVFALPFMFFLATRRIRMAETPKYLLMFFLGGMQGVLGWYMVKSGLVNDPHVSQYRLTALVMAALLIYGYMLWVALDLLYRERDGNRHGYYGRTFALTALITTTIVSGGFVAGLKAGLAYNTFPLMGGQWIPDGMWVFEPTIRNMFDNIVTVQFEHRVLAITTFFTIVAYWVFARRADLPERVRPALHALLGVAVIQVGLGISTLLLHVPIALASAHQAVAVVLFTVVLYILHGLRGRPA
jgi:cytochrome c oxidase assembly protein subunit 15